MGEPAIQLRPARAEDCDLTFQWANDPETRAASFFSQPITLQTHRRWYEQSLAGARTLLIVERENQPIGLTRLDPVDEKTAEVGLVLDPQIRGRGLAVSVLQALLDVAALQGIDSLIARIRIDNVRSRKVFERAGFRRVAEETVGGIDAVRYNYDVSDAHGD